MEPLGSSNATTRDDWVPGVREEGVWTQLGFWVILREAYVGLCAMREWWHSSGVHGLQSLLEPTRTLLIKTLNHLTLARAVICKGVLRLALT